MIQGCLKYNRTLNCCQMHIILPKLFFLHFSDKIWKFAVKNDTGNTTIYILRLSDITMTNQSQIQSLEPDVLAQEIERFSGLSSEIISLLEKFKTEINKSAGELREVQAAVNSGKRELEAFSEIKMEMLSLERQIEDLRQQKEILSRTIVDQQSAWTEEMVKHARDKEEYEKDAKAKRQKEEEHRQAWENEQIMARQKFQGELDSKRQEWMRIQAEASERMTAKEEALNNKERELVLLVQEVEKFLSGLAGRMGGAAKAGLNAP